ncbi:uncharacterized mitochondrial protein AtMg00860-like [Pyrus communis]|uniref:uncharacterized mitochondrial protein AtMg00860-like n=1 Tax=Pyrus communis TaxID=23211 RepID=UPI0035C1CD85
MPILAHTLALDERFSWDFAEDLHYNVVCLNVKLSKCLFSQDKIEYLEHTISGQGVSANSSKIQAIIDWPQSTSIKGLRGFLGLIGYYRKFVHHYGLTGKPLTSMLQQGNFKWTDESIVAFEKLKQALASTPVLAILDFTKTFVVTLTLLALA